MFDNRIERYFNHTTLAPRITSDFTLHMATSKGLEPSTSSVTGWRSTLLNYEAKWLRRWDLNP